MKKFYLFTILNLCVAYSQAQYFQWAKREGLYAYDYGYGASTDNSGNLYVAGKYEMNAIFSGNTVTCAGNHDIYLAKYDPSGSLSWIRTAGGTLGDYAHANHCDGSDVYVTGEIEGVNNPIAFSNSSITLTSVGDNDIFTAKYDLNGNLLWAKSEGWFKSDKGLGVTTDNTGNVYVCGYFTDTTKVNGTQINGVGGEDLLIIKYNNNGVFQWVVTAGGPGRDEAKSIKCDAAGNIYVCGLYSNGANFSGTTMTCTAGYYDCFVAKYSPGGAMQWVKQGGGAYDDVAWSLTLDNQDKVYVTGEFNAYATFGTTGLTTTGLANIFIASYDGSGNVLWAKSAGGTLVDRARGIGTDGTNLYITGQFGATAAFDSYSVTAADSSDIFVAAFNSGGNFMWTAAVGGVPDAYESLGYESGIAVCARGGDVYATGALLDGGIFGGTSLSPYSRTDVFITRLNSTPAGIHENSLAENISVYPNPGNGLFMVDLAHYSGQQVDVIIYNSLGQLVESKIYKPGSAVNIDLLSQANGIYFAEIKTQDQLFARKKLILQH